MKDLLTFIFGLILIIIGGACVVNHYDFISFWDYFWVALGCLNIFWGFEKLHKSTN